MTKATPEEQRAYESIFQGYMRSAISRKKLLATAAAGLAAAAVPAVASADTNSFGRAPFTEFPFFPNTTGRYETESISTILNTAVTAEHLAVTVLTAAVNNASTLGLSSNPLLLATVQAALAEEFYHLSFLRDSAGAVPLTTTFTVPDPKILTDQVTFFSTLEVAENIFIAAYMTAVREFAEMGQPTLAKIAYQTGATEAEHRVLVRAALALGGDQSKVPQNNKAFETDLLLYVGDAVGILKQLGFVGGTGTPVTYPGDAAAMTAMGQIGAAIIQKTPNNASSTVTVTGAADLTGQRS